MPGLVDVEGEDAEDGDPVQGADRGDVDQAEMGQDLSQHQSKHIDKFLQQKVETVITVCGNAAEACPVFPGQVNRHHFPFDDPAHATGTEEEQLVVFRRVRDEISKVFGAYVAGRLDEARHKIVGA